MISREMNWVRTSEGTDSGEIKDADMDSKYFEHYQQFTDHLPCKEFKAVVKYAYTKMIEYTNKKNHKQTQAETLHLICVADGNYFDVTIFCKFRNANEQGEFTTWGQNTNDLNDWLEIACRQKENILECYSFESYDGEHIVYPHMCGVEVSLIGASRDTRVSNKGKPYDSYTFAVFDSHRHSGWELKNNTKEILDYPAKLEQLSEVWLKFCEDNGIEAQEPEVTETTNSFDDDLPF